MKHLNKGIYLLWILSLVSCQQSSKKYDLVIYGGTAAGVAAAIQAKRMNKTVIIIEPGTLQQLGGLTSGGLGRTDFGNKKVIGGISLEFYKEIKNYYDNDSNWVYQNRKDYFDNQNYHPGSTNIEEESMWFFEPSAAHYVFKKWIREYNIPVIYGERIVRKGEAITRSESNGMRIALPGRISEGVVRKKGRITKIIMESGLTIKGRYFIDSTYEGDLMAGAGVAFTIGREGFDIYNESLNGIRTRLSIPDQGVPTYRHHQFEPAVDPYKTKGNPESGLLPMIQPDGPGEESRSDHRIQAYCYRMCLTDAPENHIPFTKPDNYNEMDYELLFRNYEAGFNRLPWINSPMPNRKTDTNNQSGFSTDFIGGNYEYPEASYSEREKIKIVHRDYQKGLMWTLANHPRIPEQIRTEISRWGLTKDEFIEGNGWQYQLYVREARRMISDVIMIQDHCEGKVIDNESVGMGAYGMDSHHTQRYVDQLGFVKNEGDVQIGVKSPYPISFRSIMPRKSECSNLLVPICLSASHIAYGSIRMEPVFMVLGQSASTAACLAIEEHSDIQDLPYEKLKSRLHDDGQILQLDDLR